MGSKRAKKKVNQLARPSAALPSRNLPEETERHLELKALEQNWIMQGYTNSDGQTIDATKQRQKLMRRVMNWGLEKGGAEAAKVLDILARVEQRAHSLALKRQLADDLPDQIQVDVDIDTGPSAGDVAAAILADPRIRSSLDEA